MSKTARLLLLALVFAVSAFGCASAPPPRNAAVDAAAERVVLVTIDTLRADHVGCYGASGARTLTLDLQARRGTRFETAIAPTPLTLPSHTTLLTGLDPSHHGVHHNGVFELAEGIPTLAEQMREAGFATAAFVAAAVLDRRYGLARGFDVYEDTMSFSRTVPSSGGVAELRAQQVIDRALGWLESAPDRFFLWVHLYDPHANYRPPAKYVPAGPTAGPGRAESGAFEAARASMPRRYAGEIHYTDTELGRLTRRIDRRFGDGRTLFVVTSDHGESLGEHEELTHSLSLYDATQRVPLIFTGPRVPRARVVKAPVRLADVAPTILAIADVPPLPATTGVDLQPWLRGQRDEPLEAYVETLAPQLDYGWSPILGLRTERYKYLRTTRPELYDLGEDPDELVDLAAVRPELISQLDARLATRLDGALPIAMRPPPQGEERALLESLGYVVDTRSDAPVELGPVGGPDAKDHRPALVQLFEASSHRVLGNFERARAALEGAPDAGGWVAHARAEIALELGDAVGAEREARRMVERRPAAAEGYFVLARALELQSRPDEARTSYLLAYEADPSQTDALVALGVLEERAGRFDAAAARYEQVLDTRSPHFDAVLRLAAIRFDQGRPDEASALLRSENLAVASPEAVIRLLRAEAAAGRETSARRRARRARAAATRPESFDEVQAELGVRAPR